MKSIAVFPNYHVYKHTEEDPQFYQKRNELAFYTELVDGYSSVKAVAFWKKYGADGAFDAAELDHVKLVSLGHWLYEMPNTRKLLAYAGAIFRIVQTVASNERIYLYLPGSNSVIAGLAAVLLRRSFAAYVRNGLDRQPRILRACYRVILRHADFVVCTGRAIELAASKFNSSTYHVSPMIPFAITDVCEPLTLEERSTVRLLYVGTLNQTKGVFDLIEIVKSLDDLAVDFELKIVGNVHEKVRRDLQESIERHDLKSRITMVDFISHPETLKKLYSDSHIFLYPSVHNEGFPRVLYEAMLFGCLIVTYRLDSYLGFLVDQVNCLMVEPGASGDAAKAIQEAVGNPTVYLTVARKGNKDAVTYLSEVAAVRHGHQVIEYFRDAPECR